MSASVFDHVADQIIKHTSLAKLEARGTLRIAVREAGLDARSITAGEMAVVLQRVMPKEFDARGIEDASGICEQIVASLADGDFEEASGESPEAVFARLGR